jgi:hypothetical protein
MHDKLLNTKGSGWSENQHENESEEAFQERVDEAGKEMKTWDWDTVGNDYLDVVSALFGVTLYNLSGLVSVPSIFCIYSRRCML